MVDKPIISLKLKEYPRTMKRAEYKAISSWLRQTKRLLNAQLRPMADSFDESMALMAAHGTSGIFVEGIKNGNR